jgi:hypothetical protein
MVFCHNITVFGVIFSKVSILVDVVAHSLSVLLCVYTTASGSSV